MLERAGYWTAAGNESFCSTCGHFLRGDQLGEELRSSEGVARHVFFRLMLAFFKIAGYSLACGAQSLWYLAHGKPELVGDAIGYFGRDVTNAIADIFGKG